MIGERENFDSEMHYGNLVMRHYDIDGNDIDAFYDSSDNLVFVLDNTVNSQKPNILLVINPESDKKWDEILSGDYGVDLETIRPKADNKYQKFDIEYSGLNVYDALIKAFGLGNSLEDELNQLTILRDSAARHSAMTRLNVANEMITKTNATIVKTKESLVRLQARLKTLRAKLAEAKKGIGREPTKQSAAKILKLESQIDATNEKLKRANERLKSAQRRLETATVDAKLASDLLNQPSVGIKQTVKKAQPVVVAAKRPAPVVVSEEPEYDEETEEIVDEDMPKNDMNDTTTEEYTEEAVEETEEFQDEDDKKDENESESVKPLFNEDPQILNNDIAFKPISFEAPTTLELSDETSEEMSDEVSEEKAPDLNHDMIVSSEDAEETKEPDESAEEKENEESDEEKPVLESMLPVAVSEEKEPEIEFEEDKEEFEPEFDTVPTEEETKVVEYKPLNLEKVEDNVRQPEPVFDEEIESVTEEKRDEIPPMPRPPVPPVLPVSPTMPQSASNIGITHEPETQKSKSSFLYYMFLIVLIVLAIFTLWLYQRSVKKPAVPTVAATAERMEADNSTSVLKKSGKARKPIKVTVGEEKEMPTFLNKPKVKEEPVNVVEEVEVVVEKKPKVQEIEEVVVETVQTAPEVVDAVPARLSTSGQSEEEPKKVLSEEEILASKPEYQPGSRYDEMFVSEVSENESLDDDYVEVVDEEPEYVIADDEIIQYDENEGQDPFYDVEEMEYQAGFYEE